MSSVPDPVAVGARLAESFAVNPPSVEAFESFLPRDLSRLRGLRHDLGSWLDDNDVGPEQRDAVILAVHEAAANAIQHAGSQVVVSGSRDGDEVSVVVRNTGRWTGSRPNVELARGRGLTIMHGLMSNLEISRQPDGTTVRMRLELAPSRTEEALTGRDADPGEELLSR